MTWEALSDAIQEEEARLSLSEQFHQSVEEVLNTLHRWVQPVQELPHSLAAVEGLLKEIQESSDSLSALMDDCLGKWTPSYSVVYGGVMSVFLLLLLLIFLFLLFHFFLFFLLFLFLLFLLFIFIFLLLFLLFHFLLFYFILLFLSFLVCWFRSWEIAW